MLSPVIMATGLVAACGGSDLVLPGGAQPAGIRVVNGDGQTGPAGQLLTAPIVVEVTDADSTPVGGASVEFALISAGSGAEIQPATATTDASGRAEAHLLLGDKLGLQTGEARVMVESAQTPRTSFTAVATAVTPDNRLPTADFDWHCDNLGCQFTDTSTDEDGSVTGRSWTFGDGDSSEQTNPAHTYGAGGTYTVTLTVTDDDGATDAASTQLTATAPTPPPDPNKPPDADFEVHCSELICTFIDQSKDDDGTIVAWQWSFGDGATSTERNPLHMYAEEGDYDVLVMVTDNGGATDTKLHRADPHD